MNSNKESEELELSEINSFNTIERVEVDIGIRKSSSKTFSNHSNKTNEPNNDMTNNKNEESNHGQKNDNKGNTFLKFTNIINGIIEKKIAILEGGEAALLTPSSQSALLITINSIAKAGDNIIASGFVNRNVFGLFKKINKDQDINFKFLYSYDPNEYESLIDENTKCIYIESIGTAVHHVSNLEEFSKIAHRHGIPLIVDNTSSMGGYLVQPIKYGADIVIHTTTKWITERCSTSNGVIIDSGNFNWKNNSDKFPKITKPISYNGGPTFSESPDSQSFIRRAQAELRYNHDYDYDNYNYNNDSKKNAINAFLSLLGIESLTMNAQKRVDNALELAQWLKTREEVAWVHYNGFPDHITYSNAKKYLKCGYGGTLTFGLKKGYDGAVTFVSNYRQIIKETHKHEQEQDSNSNVDHDMDMINNTYNNDDLNTFILHPFSNIPEEQHRTFNESMGITSDLISVSVGIENIEDIKSYFIQSFNDDIKKEMYEKINSSSAINKGKITYFINHEKKSWFGNIMGDIWGGAVTTFALLPETIGFMIAAGVPPYIGLYTCIILTIILAVAGGRPGVISAGAGSTAMITVGLVAKFWESHPEYLFAAVILAGVIQFFLGIVRFGNLIKYIPQCVMNGFVNGLAIFIFISQISLIFKDRDSLYEMLALVAIGVGIIVFFPYLSKLHWIFGKIPSSIVTIVALSVYAIASDSSVLRIHDIGTITPSFEYVGVVFRQFSNIFTVDCFVNILPVSLSIAMVGIIETMLTCRVVTEETKTPEQENLNRECCGQGIGNAVCGCLGAMPGCAMIGQTKANLGAGGRGRLSSLFTGVLLSVLLFTVSNVLGDIPAAALVAVMLVVCYNTVNWNSVIKCYKVPIKETIAMVLTVIIVLTTDNLAYGVGVGLCLYITNVLLKMFVINEKVILGMSLIAHIFSIAMLGVTVYAFIKGGPSLSLLVIISSLLAISLISLVRNEMITSSNIKLVCTKKMVKCTVLLVAAVVFMYI